MNHEAARTFLSTHARLLERRLAEATDLTGALGVLAALSAYRNADGGLGQALEPDVRAPDSQPLAVDFGLMTVEGLLERVPEARDAAREFAAGLLPYLASTAAPDGGLPLVTPAIAAYPRAGHWAAGEFPPGLNPTAGITTRLRGLGLESPWLDTADRFCRKEIEAALAAEELDAHTALNVLTYLEGAEDDWSAEQLARFEKRVPSMTLLHVYPGEGYGLTPLDFAPMPSSPRRRFFPEDAVTAHLDALEKEQQEDGGWPIPWAPPGPAAELEWRGVVTLHALRTLAANGR